MKATELNPQTIKNSQRTVASINEAPVPGTQFVTLDHNQLEEALAVLDDTAEQINDQSMAFEDHPVIEKQLEKDYRAIVAVQNVMKNNLRAIKNPHLMANSIFLYDIDDEDVSLIDFVGAIHVVMHDHVAEVKWIGSYGAHGGALLRAAMKIAKQRGATSMKLDAKWESEGFYHKMGFEQTGATVDQPLSGSQLTPFSKRLEEARFQEIVHKNPSIATLKALARNNKYHSARFVIYKDGSVVAGDSEHFTHQDIAPAMGAWEVRGYVQYMGDNDYAYRSMEVYSPQNKDHPMFRIWERSGIVNGNPEVVEEKWSAKYKRSIDCHHPRGFSQRAHCAARRKRQAGGKTASKSVNENNLDQLVHNILENLITQGLTETQAVEHVDQQLTEDLRKWFRQKWVRFGPDGKIRGACARGSEGEGKPKCLPQKKAWALGKKQRATAARRKRREDPNPEREGKARNVATRESIAEVTKVRISLDPNDLGAYVYDEDPPEPTTMIPLGEITNVLEPDQLHDTKPGAKARIARMVKALEKGKQLPPVLVRKYQGGYQILDGHHRFKAYRMVNAKEIPARIVAPENITGDITEQSQATCPHCGGPVYDRVLAEKHDACYYKVKSRYKVWPSAYASGALVQCRKRGAKNWGKDS